MELKFNIDENCDHCKQGIAYFKSLHKQNKKAYANLNLETKKLINTIVLSPDYNCSGHLTHFHIFKGSKPAIKNLLASIISQDINSYNLKIKNGTRKINRTIPQNPKRL